MTAAFSGAWTVMTAATHLDEQAAHAHLVLIWLNTQQGERAWDPYLTGVQRSPDSMLLRQAMLANLRTEWGGSERDMQAFITRPEHGHLPQCDRDTLSATFWRHVGHYRQHFNHDTEGAFAAYEQSLAITRTAGALAGIADLTGGRRGRRLLDEATQLAPQDLHLKARRAVAYLRTWRPARPYLRDLDECRQWGEPYATDILSDTPGWLLSAALRLATVTGRG